MQEIFNFYLPESNPIALISIPHSGENFPLEFNEYLTKDLRALAEDVDYKVDELVDIKELNKNGIAVLVSNIHRTAVDLNRSEDLAIIAWKKNSQGVKLQTKDFDEKFKEDMLNKYHRPYFYVLKSSIERLFESFKRPVIIDLHSMPSKPTEYHLKVTPDQPKVRPHFCISDISGQSCSKEFIDSMESFIKEFDKDTTQNIPYYGGHITRYIQDKFPLTNNIQIEISREIYMDELERSLITDKVNFLKPRLTQALIKQVSKFIL